MIYTKFRTFLDACLWRPLTQALNFVHRAWHHPVWGEVFRQLVTTEVRCRLGTAH